MKVSDVMIYTMNIIDEVKKTFCLAVPESAKSQNSD